MDLLRIDCGGVENGGGGEVLVEVDCFVLRILVVVCVQDGGRCGGP